MRSEKKRLLRESKDNYLGSLKTDFVINTKRLSFVLKHKSKSRGLPLEVSMASDQAPSPSRVTADTTDAIADLFNIYFVFVFTSDSASNTNTDTEGLLQANPDPCLSNLIFTTSDVILVIKGLDANKATGPDNIPVRLLKETVDVIVPSLCNLFNNSIRLGKFPREWKTASVFPIHNIQHAENYRPISFLLVVSKVMERCVFNGIKERVC